MKKIIEIIPIFVLVTLLGMVTISPVSAYTIGDTIDGFTYDGQDTYVHESVGVEINPNTTLEGVRVNFFNEMEEHDPCTVELKDPSTGDVLDSASFDGGYTYLYATLESGHDYWIVVDGYQSNAYAHYPNLPRESGDFDITEGVREDGVGGNVDYGNYYIWDINEVTALVNSPPSVDSLSINPSNPDEGEYVDYTVNASDSDGHIDEIELTVYEDGTQVYNNTKYNDSYFTLYNVHGANGDTSLKADVRVEDDDGADSYDSRTDHVNAAPDVDSFYPNPHPPNVNESVDYTVDASDSDGHIDEIELTLYDDGTQVYNDIRYNDSYHTFSDIYTPSSDGQLEADVRVEDDDGSNTYDSITDYVNMDPNFDSASADPSGGTTVDSTSPTLSVDVSDPDGDSMDVSFYDASDDTQIGSTQNNVSDGGTASVTWSGLDTGTNYSWYTVAEDSSLTTQSTTWNFTTDDGSAPLIENIITTDRTKDSIVVSWDTNEAADSLVNYGDTTSYGDNVSDSADNLNHSLKISNLNTGTTYHFKVRSVDSVGNENWSNDFTFTTFENSSQGTVSDGVNEFISVTEPDTRTETSVEFDTSSSSGETTLGLDKENPGGTTPSGKSSVRFVSVSSDISNADLDNVDFVVNYSDSDVSDVDESSLTFYYWNESSESWEDYNENVNLETGNNSVTLSISHFSSYAVMGNDTTSDSTGDVVGGAFEFDPNSNSPLISIEIILVMLGLFFFLSKVEKI